MKTTFCVKFNYWEKISINELKLNDEVNNNEFNWNFESKTNIMLNLCQNVSYRVNMIFWVKMMKTSQIEILCQQIN